MNDQNCPVRRIREILAGREIKVLDDMGREGYRHAGVLLPLLEEGGVCKVLFTQRTQLVEHHKGQISFPGGAVEAEDASIEATVLRETFEEIGLSTQDIEILGSLDDALTLASNFIIHPVVGVVTSLDNLRVNRSEVDRVIMAPLNFFSQPPSENSRYRVEYEGMTYETPAYKYGEHMIWGATARMMQNLVEILEDKLYLPQTPK